jgi:phosphohistidine phosphatase
MKLYFLRHGRADRSAWMGLDYERPLTGEGKERMAREADFIAQLDLGIDVILTSPLVRAYQTAEIVAERLNMLDLLTIDERLEPGFGPQDLAEILEGYPDADEIMLVGHEPDFSETISYLIGGGNILCKKGSLARVDLVDAGPMAGELVWLIPPKALILLDS